VIALVEGKLAVSVEVKQTFGGLQILDFRMNHLARELQIFEHGRAEDEEHQNDCECGEIGEGQPVADIFGLEHVLLLALTHHEADSTHSMEKLFSLIAI
jgi:hypothetical protein